MYLGWKYLLKWLFLCFALLSRQSITNLWFPLPFLSLGRGSGEKKEEQLTSKESPNSSNWFSQAPKVQKLQGNIRIQQGDVAQMVTGTIKM